AGLTLYMKSAEPVTSLFGGISFLFGGIMFPVESMPAALQKISWFLPMTHGVEGIRFSLLHGRSIFDLSEHALVLAAWAVFMIPVSLAVLNRIIVYLRKSGSFGSY
ncbi:MAG: ABC transporter permease, partial [Deltaproteobacteria bacterium]|nr:ABC transporter permease [Deltaproteobacteria bacterium]